jgi:alkylhydroperoxidase family enzyme
MPPVDPADLTESQRAMAGLGASNVIRTLVRHPDLLNAWLGLGTKLLFSENPFVTRTGASRAASCAAHLSRL